MAKKSAWDEVLDYVERVKKGTSSAIGGAVSRVQERLQPAISNISERAERVVTSPVPQGFAKTASSLFTREPGAYGRFDPGSFYGSVKQRPQTLEGQTETAKDLAFQFMGGARPIIKAPSIGKAPKVVEVKPVVRPTAQPLKRGKVPHKAIGKGKLQVPQIAQEVAPLSKIARQAPLKGEVNLPSPNARLAKRAQLGSPSRPSIPQGFENPKDPFYNINRLNVSNKAKTQLKEKVTGEFKPAFDKAFGKKMSADEIIKQAQVTSDELIKQVGRQKTVEFGAAQLRLRQNIAQMVDSGNVDKELLEKIMADKTFSSNTARLLQQRVINADPISPNGKLLQKMLDNILSVNDDIDAVLAKAKGVDFNDPKQAMAFYREFIKPTAGDWIDKLRYNSMLTSPNTHVINITSNWQGTGILTPIQKTIEGGIDAALSVFNPNRKRTRFAGEGVAYAKGYYNPEAVKASFKNLWNILSGKRLSEHPDVRGIPLSTGGASRMVENILDVGGKALEGVDQLFKTLTTSGLEEQYKYRALKGVKNAPSEFATEAEKLLFRGKLTEPGAGVVSNAVGGFGEWVKRGTQSKQQVVRWTVKLTMPFINIGTNLAKSGFEHNPVTGTLNMIGNEDKIAQAAKVFIGSAVVATAVPFALSDRLTFKLPQGKTGDAAREAGMQDYSIKIGDKWIQYTKMHPALSWQLGMVASITDAMKNGKITEDAGSRLMEGAWSWLQFGLDQTYYKNVSDFMAGVNGSVERFAAIPSNYASQFIPFRAFASWINRMIDTYQRKPDTDAGIVTQSIQSIMKQLPGLSQLVPIRKNRFGQPMTYTNQQINMVSPWRISTEKPEMKQQYEDLKIINRINQEEAVTSKAEKEKAQKLFDHLNTLPAQEAAAKFKELRKRKPSLAAKVWNLTKKGQKSVTEQSIQSLGIDSGGRAKFIATKMKTMTLSEQNAYVKDLIRKKLINAKVMIQLKNMKARGEL